MDRFFCSPGDIRGNLIIIKGQEAHHIKNVLRKKLGDFIEICDGTGNIYKTIIKTIDKEIECYIDSVSNQKEIIPDIKLYQGIPKGEKMELIIQKAVELGIGEIIPIITERTVVKLKENNQQKKLERWKKISVEASKQSKRTVVPPVSDAINIKDIPIDNKSMTIIPWEEEKDLTLRNCIDQIKNREYSKINVVIGPEGGLTQDEVISLKNKGAVSVTLGSRILRTETASLSVISILMYELGDL